MMMMLLVALFMVLQNCRTKTVLFTWFDDLPFADANFNGAKFPTPILNELANDGAIKINFHYSEQICSASRSSLLTGRYAYRSGVNEVINKFRSTSFDPTLTLWPQILQNEGFTGFMAGKWHIGYWSNGVLPHQRGFKKGLVTHIAGQYYVRGYELAFDQIDNKFGAPSERVQSDRLAVFCNSNYYTSSHGPGEVCDITNFELSMHDTWSIVEDSNGDPIEIAKYAENTDYNEDLYTTEIKQFIQDQSVSNEDIFIYYSMWTPHNDVDPPVSRPDGSSFGYDCGFEGSTPLRRRYCKQIQYASKNVEEIIDELKINSLYDESLIIITSDNGGAPGDGGQSIPLRGQKNSAYEGGVRTPALIRGSLVDDLFAEWGITSCEYNGLVHISDWYHIIMDAMGTDTNADYSPDSDHSTLELWEDIKCACNPNCDETTQYTERNEMAMIRQCGSGDFHGSFIRQNEWKLIIKGSESSCQNGQFDKWSSYQTWNEIMYTIPNENYYDDIYQPQFNADPDRANLLYKSECLEELYSNKANGSINDENFYHFTYNDVALYHVGSDAIEACNVGDDYPDKVTELLLDLDSRLSAHYNVPDDPGNDILALKALFESYECNATHSMTYMVPWDDAGSVSGINALWKNIIKAQAECNALQQNIVPYEDNKYVSYWTRHYNMNNVMHIMIPITLVTLSIAIFVTIVCVCGYLKEKRIDSDIEITVDDDDDSAKEIFL